jgi:hypothetical protein
MFRHCTLSADLRLAEIEVLLLQASDDSELLQSPEGIDAQQAITQHAAAINSEGG